MKSLDRNVWIIIGILIALFWLSVPASAIIPGWSTPQTIDGPPKLFAYNTHLAYSAPGQWHVVGTNSGSIGSKPLSNLKYIDSAGVTKTLASDTMHVVSNHPSGPIYGGPNIVRSDIASDANGNLGVIYQEKIEGERKAYLYYISCINGIWSDPVRIYDYGNCDYLWDSPQLAFSAPEEWHVVDTKVTWKEGGIQKYELIYVNSTGYNTTLATAQIDGNEGTYISGATIASDSDGNLGIVYIDGIYWGEGSNKYISCINGIWSDPEPFIGTPSSSYDFAFSAPRQWHMVRSGSGAQNLIYLNSTGFTGTLVSGGVINYIGHEFMQTAIASDSNGNLGVIYWDYENTGRETHEFSIKYMFNNVGPDLWISEVKPVQVVWDSDINGDGKIDLVAQKLTAIVANITIENPDALDQTMEIPVQLIYDGQIKDTQSKTVEKIRNNGLINLSFTPSTEGDHEVLVIVDPENIIPESNDTNNTHSQKVTVKAVKDLFIGYFPITNPRAPYSTKFSRIDLNKYQSTAQNSNKFILATFPISIIDFHSSIKTEYQISADWPVKEDSKHFNKSVLKDLNTVKKLGTKSESPYFFSKYVGIVPSDYFSAHKGKWEPCKGVYSYTVPDTALSTEGYYAAGVPHEIAHSFGIHYFGEEYDNVQNQHMSPTTDYKLGGKAVSGMDVTDIYGRGTTNNYVWHSELDDNPFTANGLCFMGNSDGINTYYWVNPQKSTEQLPRWICKEDYINLFKKLRTNPIDPELLFVSGTFSEEGTFSLDSTYWIESGFPDEMVPGEYSIVLFDKDKQIISTTPFSDPYKAIIEPYGIVRMETGVMAFTIPFPKEVATVQLTHSGKVISEFNPHEQLLADAIDNIPTTGFVKNPDQRRKAMQNKVAALDKMIADKKYGEARDKLRDDIKKSVQNWLKDGYSTTDPLEITKEDLLKLIDNTIERLDALAK
jgi:hypothetical protein